MMFLLWFFWGSWPLFRKQGGTGNVDFGLTYVIMQVLATLLLCFSMGMVSLKDTRHFDDRHFHEVMAEEFHERIGAVLLSCLAGSVLCAGDFLMACAIDVFGVVVACPVGFGIALIAGSTLNYVIEPKADPALLFPGVVACFLGMLCDALSHAGDQEKNVAVKKVAGQAEEMDKVDTLEAAAAVPAEVVLESVPVQKQIVKPYHWALPLAGGCCCASFGPISTAAATFGKLDPYAVYFSFMIGQLLTVFPHVCLYTRLTEAEHSLWQVPSVVLRRYADACREKPRGFIWNSCAGIAVGSGYFLFFIGSPVVSRAVGFIFGCSGLLLSIFAGVFVFREYKDASPRRKALVAGASIFITTALGLMSVAGRD